MHTILAGCLVLSVLGDPAGPVAHWRLQGDCRNACPGGADGINHGARLGPEGAAFDGLDDWIELPAGAFRPGKGDFTVGVWVHTDQVLDDVLGDILSQYDPQRRRGFSLGLMDSAGVTSAQANYRNLSFGIDAGRIDPAWTDCGRPGNNVYVMALAVYDGGLYAGTYEEAAGQTGHVYRYEGGTRWTNCGSPDRANGVGSMAVWNGKLYAGSARYNAGGSLLAKSGNWEPGGRVFRYEGGTRWTDCGRLGEANEVFSMAVFRDRLYACPLYKEGRGLYRYEGGARWTIAALPPEDRRIQPLALFNGSLYGGSYNNGRFFRYDGERTLLDLGQVPDTSQVYSFAIHEGRLFAGTWPTGSVFVFDGQKSWLPAGRLGEEKEVMAVGVYNGKLYAGTLPLAQVYRYDGGTQWTLTGQLDRTPNVKYRRAWSMAVYQGKLFCGTLPSGHVFSLEAGRCATCDRELPAGWHHVAAARRADRLTLYVDGRCVGQSSTFQPADYDLNQTRPLKVGFGPRDYFRGQLRDLRIYARALPEREIEALAGSKP